MCGEASEATAMTEAELTEADWQGRNLPVEMLYSLEQFEWPSGMGRKFRLFAVAAVWPYREHVVDQRSLSALGVAAQVADGLLPVEHLAPAHRAAWATLPGPPVETHLQVCVARAAGRTVEEAPFHAALYTHNEVTALEGELGGDRVNDFKGRIKAQHRLANLLREIFGNPFRPVSFSPAWRTDTAVSLAKQMYDSRDFALMPILADALQDAGCDNDDILNHCRGPGPHVRGCWVVDLVLGRE
jgi:hypothetical protein